MIIIFILIGFLEFREEYFSNLKKAFESKDHKVFIQSVNEITNLKEEELPDELREYIIKKVLEEFDKEIKPLQRDKFYIDFVKFLEKLIGEPKRDYRNSILKLYQYASGFHNTGYEEEFINRLVTKELVIGSKEKVIDILKKRESEIFLNDNLFYALSLILNLNVENTIDLEMEEKLYVSKILLRIYDNSKTEKKCEIFINNIKILRDVWKDDKRIIEEAELCISKEDMYFDVLTYHFALIENHIKDADKLIENCLKNVKDKRIVEIENGLIDDYRKNKPLKLSKEDFYYLSEKSKFKNPCYK